MTFCWVQVNLNLCDNQLTLLPKTFSRLVNLEVAYSMFLHLSSRGTFEGCSCHLLYFFDNLLAGSEIVIQSAGGASGRDCLLHCLVRRLSRRTGLSPSNPSKMRIEKAELSQIFTISCPYT
jgi:hypothetical protein